MPHELLDALGVHAVLDPQRSAGVTQGVQAVLSRVLFVSDSSGLLKRSEAVFDYVGVGLDLAATIRKNESEIALRADQLPLAKAVEDDRGRGIER